MARPLITTAYGNTSFNSTTKQFGSHSVYFDGVDDYVITNVSDQFAWGSGNFTIEFWINPNGIPTEPARQWLFHQADGLRISLQKATGQTDGQVIFSSNNQGLATQLISDDVVTESVWNHIAFVRNGNTLTVYVDGVNEGTLDVTNLNVNTDDDAYIGIDSTPGLSSDYAGYLDELRISTVARYTTNFTPPTAAFKNDGNTVLLLHFDNDLVDDVEPSGSASISATAATTGTATPNPSMVFLGNDVYTWDDTDDWTEIYLDDDRWRVRENISSEFGLTVSGTYAITGEADLTSDSTVTATGGLLQKGHADLTVTATQTTRGGLLQDGEATITADTEVTVSAQRLPGGTAQLTSDSTITADADVTLVGRADFASEFTSSFTGRIVKFAEMQAFTEVELTARAQVQINAESQLDTQFDQTARGGRLITLDDPYEYTWDTIDPDQWDSFVRDEWGPEGWFAFDQITLTASASQSIDAQASIQSEFSIDATALSLDQASASLATEFQLTVEAVTFDLASADLESQFTVTGSAGYLVDAQANLSDAFAFAVTAEDLDQASASLTTEFTISTRATLIPAVLPFNLNTEFTVEASAGFLRSSGSDLEAFASQLTAGARLPGSGAELDSEFTVTATGSMTLNASADFEAFATEFIDGRISNVRGTADLTVESTVTAKGGVILPFSADLEAFTINLVDGRISNVRGAAALASEFDTEFDGDLRLFESNFIFKVLPELRSIGRSLVNYRSARTITARGSAALTSVQAKFGSGSVSITNIGDLITVSGTSDLYSGDFTVDMWIWNANLTQMPNGVLWDIRTSASSGLYVYVSYGSIGLYEGITGKGLTSAGFVNSSWNHIAIVRNSNNLKIFVNGVQKISATVTTTNYSSRTTYVAGTYNNNIPLRGYIDELRLSNTARYTTAFTAPISPFSNDEYVRALVHFDGSLEDDIKIRSTVKTDTEIPRETRQQPVLPDSRHYQLKSETGIFQILPESRSLDMADL